MMTTSRQSQREYSTPRRSMCGLGYSYSSASVDLYVLFVLSVVAWWQTPPVSIFFL